MQPHHQAAQALRYGGDYQINLAKNLGLTAAGGLGAKAGALALGSLLPQIKALINDFIPENITRKGLEKLDPRFKTFFNGTKGEGYDFNEIKNFLGEKVQQSEQQTSQEQKPSTPQGGNILSQYSPELQQFVEKQLGKGLSIGEAGTTSLVQPGFDKIISKLEKDQKKSWHAILKSIYGKAQAEQKALPQQPEQPQQQTGQPGPGMQKLMQLLQSRGRQ